MVYVSVCLSVTVLSPAKNGWTDREAVWVVDSDRPKDPSVRWGPDPPCEGAILRAKGTAHCKVSAMSCAKTADPINLLFGLWTRTGPRKHAFDGVHIGANWQIRLNHPCAAAMRHFCWKTLTPCSKLMCLNLGVHCAVLLQERFSCS